MNGVVLDFGEGYQKQPTGQRMPDDDLAVLAF
jgi:hypothetical protein